MPSVECRTSGPRSWMPVDIAPSKVSDGVDPCEEARPGYPRSQSSSGSSTTLRVWPPPECSPQRAFLGDRPPFLTDGWDDQVSMQLSVPAGRKLIFITARELMELQLGKRGRGNTVPPPLIDPAGWRREDPGDNEPRSRLRQAARCTVHWRPSEARIQSPSPERE